jgi:hypothetical protein
MFAPFYKDKVRFWHTLEKKETEHMWRKEQQKDMGLASLAATGFSFLKKLYDPLS